MLFTIRVSYLFILFHFLKDQYGSLKAEISVYILYSFTFLLSAEYLSCSNKQETMNVSRPGASAGSPPPQVYSDITAELMTEAGACLDFMS